MYTMKGCYRNVVAILNFNLSEKYLRIIVYFASWRKAKPYVLQAFS